VPELAQLKIAAESGDCVSEYAYGLRVVASNPAESLAMLTKSADQEYGPAEDAVGAYYFQRHTLDPKIYLAQRRMSVRWTSRAAFKGIPEAQGRLSEFYETGDVLPKNAALACGWLFVAIKTSERAQHAFAVGVYKNRLDRLVANNSSQVIADGQKFADSLALQTAGMNPVEADLIIAQLKLTAVYGTGTTLRAVLNHTSLKNGDTVEAPINGESVHVSCLEIKPLSAQFQLTGTSYRFSLPLGR
jgi:TPR repeat protein